AWKIIASLAGRPSGKGAERSAVDRAIRPVRAARRGREPGYLMVRLRSASLRAASLVNSKKCPAAPSSMTKAAFPRGLWAGVKITLASRKTRITVAPQGVAALFGVRRHQGGQLHPTPTPARLYTSRPQAPWRAR